MKRKFGARHNSCPNSPNYRKYSAALVEKIAERYKDYDNIVAWHINNEFAAGAIVKTVKKPSVYGCRRSMVPLMN